MANTEKPNTHAVLLQRLSSLLIGSVSTTEALTRAATLIERYTQAEAVQISALISEGERVVEIYSSGNLTTLFPPGLKRPSNGTSMRSIANRGSIEFGPDELQEVGRHGVEDFLVFLSAGYSNLIAAPVTLHSVNLGSFQLLSSHGFSKETAQVLNNVMPLIAPFLALYLSALEDAAEERISSSIERVAEAVINENAIGGVCDAVVKFARESMGIDAAILRIVDPGTSELVIEYQHGHLNPIEIAGESFAVIEDRLIPMATKRKGPTIIDEGSPEVFNDAVVLPLLEEIPSLLITPLMDNERLLGTLEFYSLNEYAYKSEHTRNVEYVANLLTSAVGHFTLIRSLSRDAEIRTFLAEVARLASAAGDLTSLVESISPELRNVIPIDRVTYYIPPEKIHLQPGSEISADGDQSTGDRDQTFPGPIDSRDGLARIIGARSADEVCFGSSQGSVPLCGEANCITAKLWDDAQDHAQGWIHLERSGVPFTPEEKQLVPEFARHISPAIDTAFSHEADLRLAQEQLRAERAEAEVKNQLHLNDAKQNFIATMSHELRTPLTSIRAFADLLNRDSKTMTERQRKQISVVRRNAEWLNILINDLLDLSSIDSGRFELQFEKVDITKLLAGMVESFGPIAEISGHDLKVILPKRPVEMVIDPNRISQVVGNLLNNAMKFSPEGTPIRLMAKPSTKGVYVYVRDEGLGIPRRQQTLVFERFVRAKSEASSRARGTGIGLYVSRMIVENHQGNIGVTSKLHSHTTMHFWLPFDAPGELRGSGQGKVRDAA